MTKAEFDKFYGMIHSKNIENYRMFIAIATSHLSEKNIIAFMLLTKDLGIIDKTIANTFKEELKTLYDKINVIKQEQQLGGVTSMTIGSDIDLSSIVKKLFKKKSLHSVGNIAAAKHYYFHNINLLFTALETSMDDEPNAKFAITMSDEPIPIDLLYDDNNDPIL